MAVINKKDLARKLIKGEQVSFTIRFVNDKLFILINSLLAAVLSKMDHLFIFNTLLTIFREIVVNALKANAKRVYFAKLGLDINDPEDYKKGMEKFKNEVIGEFDVIESELNTSTYYIKFIIGQVGDGYILRVINNVPILPEELERINFRMQKARQYNDFTDAYDDIEDDTEGAGLGIVLTILMMKNMGIDPSKFSITSDGKKTVSTILIPAELRPASITTEIKEKIVDEIEGVPTFPENIIELQSMCMDPHSSIEEISRRIKLDPALTTDVIKLSNSAGFITTNRIESVNAAVMTIGLKNLNAILTASNARKILNERYAHFEEIWDHCNKVAFYAREIALSYRMTDSVENAFMAGLLHDLGKIILLATDVKLVKHISEIVKNRKIVTSTIMEEISIGLSHSHIGSLIAEKWNFPEYLIQAIRFHHAPSGADQRCKNTTEIVYLANMYCGIETRKYSFYYVEDDILDKFQLNTESKFKTFHEILKNKYANLPINRPKK